MEGVAAQAQEFLEDEVAVEAALEQDRARRAGLGELRDAVESFRAGRLELSDLNARLAPALGETLAGSALWGLEDEDERAFAGRLAEIDAEHPELELSSVVRGHLEEIPRSDRERVQQLLAFGELIASVDSQGADGDPRLGVGPAASFMTFAWHCLSSAKEPVFLFASNSAIKAIARSGALGGAGSTRDLEQRFTTFYKIARVLEDALLGAPKLMRAGWAIEHALAWIGARVEGIPSRGSAQRSGMWQPPSRERLRELRGEGPSISAPSSSEGPTIAPPRSGSHKRGTTPTIIPPRAASAEESSLEVERLEGSRAAPSDESGVELDEDHAGRILDLASSGVIELGNESDFEVDRLAGGRDPVRVDDSELDLDPLDGSSDEGEPLEDDPFADPFADPAPSKLPRSAQPTRRASPVDDDDDDDGWLEDDPEEEEDWEEVDDPSSSGEALPLGKAPRGKAPPEEGSSSSAEKALPQEPEPQLEQTAPDRFGDSARRSKRKVVYADTQVLDSSGMSLEDALPRDRNETPFFMDRSPRADDAQREAEARDASRRQADSRRFQRDRLVEEEREEVEARAKSESERQIREREEREREERREAQFRAAERAAAKMAQDARRSAAAAGVELQYAPQYGEEVDDPSSDLLRALKQPVEPLDPGESGELSSGLIDTLPLVPPEVTPPEQTRRYAEGDQPRAPASQVLADDPSGWEEEASDGLHADALVREFRREVVEVSRSPEDESEEVARGDGLRLARDLYLEEALFEDMEEALDLRSALLLTGPPLSGKTYCARRLAIHRAGHDERTLTIRFHPDLGYADLIDGPNGSGILREFCERASADPRQTYALVLDELDRGDAGRALGEFLGGLVERGQPVRLARSQTPFTVPRNLLVIATARDLPPDPALAGRFPVVAHPGDARVLKRFLADRARGLEWVAEVLRALNERLRREGLELGHGLFMEPDLDARQVEGIWRREVLPWVSSQGVELDGLSLRELRPR